MVTDFNRSCTLILNKYPNTNLLYFQEYGFL